MFDGIIRNIVCSKYGTFILLTWFISTIIDSKQGNKIDIVLFDFRLKELGNISAVSTATRQRLQSQCDVVLDKPTYFMKLDAGKVYMVYYVQFS